MRKDIFERMKLMKKEEIEPNYAELARRYECDYRTVKKYFNSPSGLKCQRKEFPKKLNSYKEIINKKYSLGCKAVAIHRFIQKKGFDGCYTLVKNYCKTLKDEEIHKATIRFETNPGLQAQVDWKESLPMISKRGELFVVNIFLMLLGFSRMKYLQLTLDKHQDTLFDCMINACKYFGGVPKEIIFDNMRTVVDQSRSNYQEAVINDKFYQFSKDMGFEVWACRPYRPQTKGKVEALNKFMAWILPYEGEFETEEELIQILWKNESADNPENTLKTLLHRLRAMLDELEYMPSKKMVIYNRGLYRWNTELEYVVDVDQFANFCMLGDDEENPEQKLVYYLDAIEYYKGDFLPKSAQEQ